MYCRSFILLSRLHLTSFNPINRCLIASCNTHLLVSHPQQTQHRFLAQSSPQGKRPPGRIRRFFRLVIRGSGPEPVKSQTVKSQTVMQRFKRYLSITPMIERFLLRARIIDDEDLARLISKTIAIAGYSIVLVTTLGTFGVDTKPLLAGIGITGFTIGFALKEVATNFISGVFLVINKPFVRGCRIKIHGSGGGIEGLVHFIDVRYVHLKTKDGGIIMIPSSVVYTNALTVFPADDEANAGFIDITKPPSDDATKPETKSPSVPSTPPPAPSLPSSSSVAEHISNGKKEKKLKMKFDTQPVGSFKRGPFDDKL